MNRTKYIIALLLVCAFALAAVLPVTQTFAAGKGAAFKEADNALSDELIRSLIKGETEANEQISDTDIVTVMVVLEDEPMLAQNSHAVKSEEDRLESLHKEQEAVKERIANKLYKGAELDVLYTYSYVLNGFALSLPYGLIDDINEVKGVKYAYASGSFQAPELEEADIEELAETLSSVANENQTDYRGKNTVISIIDSGISFDHPIFQGVLPEYRVDRDYIDNAIKTLPLIAKQTTSSLSANEAYKSTKIPFQYDYGMNDSNATWEYTAHGVHVSGIAAGFEGVNNSVRPVAPDAQIYAMKVIGKGGSISFVSMYAAIEDSTLLGADVINMSLGAEGGFSIDEYSMSQAIENCKNAGITVACATGNSAHYSDYNRFIGYALTANIDTSMTNTPASISNSMAVANDNGSGSMSSGSSWGPVPSLELKPDISSYGELVMSSYASGNSNTYQRLTGTSMASPHVAGGMAAVKQYLTEKYPGKFEGSDMFNMVNTLLMNTATQMNDTGNIPYSPRRQGAGHMDIASAVRTPAYVTVDGKDRPKIDQYDDPSEKGVFEFDITVHNMSTEALTFNISVITETEAATTMSGPDGKPVPVMTEKSYRLNPTVETDHENDKVTVPANGEESVHIKLSLSRSDIDYIKTYFENGSYVEGFIRLIPENAGAVTLSVPFLCFYGDWTRESVLDRGFYYDDINGDPNWASQAVNRVYTRANGSSVYLGQNPYHNGASYIADRNAISPNNDGLYERLETIIPSLLRGAKGIKLEIMDGDTRYYYESQSYWERTIYSTATGSMTTGTLAPAWDAKTSYGKVLDNNTTVTVRISFEADFDKHAQNSELPVWEFPLTIDTSAPVLEDVKVRTVDGRDYVYVTVRDNQFVADITFANKAMDTVLESYAVTETEKGLTTTYCYDVTGYEKEIGLIVSDYAANRNTYIVNLVNAEQADSSMPMPGEDGMTLNGALNVPGANLDFTNDSEHPWKIVEMNGRLTAESSIAGMSGTKTSVTLDLGEAKAGTAIRFDWKVSSEQRADIGYFYVNDTQITTTSGEVGWSTYQYTLRTDGKAVLRWEYAKDRMTDSGSDRLWLDNVTVSRDVESVTLDKTELELMAGEYYDFTYTVLPIDVWNKSVTFSSSDETVAAVDRNTGKLHALKAGVTEITATTVTSGKTAVCTVTVLPLPQPREGYALVALQAPELWANGAGYHLLLDRDANAYGSVIDITAELMSTGDADYSAFEYTLPGGATGSSSNRYVISGGIEYMMVPAGTYDIAIVNPYFGSGVYYAGGESRYDDMVLREGYQYVFTVTGVREGSVTVADNAVCEAEYVGTTDMAYEPGDVNMDGRVTTGDVTMIMRHVVELLPLKGEALELADANGDGRVNSGDAAAVLKKVVS